MKNEHKLFSLVRVRIPHDLNPDHNYTIIGQVLSRPIPLKDGGYTYMVRMIPDHPGSLQEIPAERLERFTRKAINVRYAEVRPNRPRTAFPLDMLRYDHAVPVNFDFDRGVRKFPGEALSPLMVATTQEHGFTPERWESFGWTCREFITERVSQ